MRNFNDDDNSVDKHPVYAIHARTATLMTGLNILLENPILQVIPTFVKDSKLYDRTTVDIHQPPPADYTGPPPKQMTTPKLPTPQKYCEDSDEEELEAEDYFDPLADTPCNKTPVNGGTPVKATPPSMGAAPSPLRIGSLVPLEEFFRAIPLEGGQCFGMHEYHSKDHHHKKLQCY